MKNLYKKLRYIGILAIMLGSQSVLSMNSKNSIAEDQQELVDRISHKALDDEENYDDLLLEEVQKEDIEIENVKFYLSKGANVNVKNDGHTPLHLLCIQGNVEVAKLLFGCRDLDVNIKTTCYPRETPLHIACKFEYIKILQLLLSHNNIDVNIKNDEEMTALHYTCKHEQSADIVQLLINHDTIDINAQNDKGMTALHLACQSGHKKNAGVIVELLLNHKNIDLNSRDNKGKTPLHYAVGWADDAIVKSLIEHGGNIRARDNCQNTPKVYDNHIREAENNLSTFIKNPLHTAPIESLSKFQLTKIMYNLEKGNLQYKEFMYWMSKIYLNPNLLVLGTLIDQCKTNKDNKELMVNAHNFPKNSQKLMVQNNFLPALFAREPYPEFDLNFIFK